MNAKKETLFATTNNDFDNEMMFVFETKESEAFAYALDTVLPRQIESPSKEFARYTSDGSWNVIFSALDNSQTL